jgi:hypothetical protein
MQQFRATTNKYALSRRFGGSAVSPLAKYSDTFTASQQLTVPGNSAFNFGTSPFTTELWIYPTTIAIANYDLIDSDNGSIYFTVGIVGQAGGGALRFIVNNGAGGNTNSSVSATVLATNTWYHLALMRNGDSASLFVNGVCVLTMAGLAAYSIGTSTLPLYISGNSSTGGQANRFIGSLTNVRIVSGYLAYSFGTSVGIQYFIPPSVPLSIVTGTQLLLQGLADVGPNAFTVTNVGGVTTGTTPSPFA